MARRLHDFSERAAEIAKQYDGKQNQQSLTLIARSIAKLPDQCKLNIMDLGGGAGHYAYLVSQQFNANVKVIDSHYEMLKEGYKRWYSDRLSWHVDALPELKSLKDAAHDFSMALGVFHYLDTDERVQSLRRIAELTKEQGRLVVSYPYPPSRPKDQFALSPDQFMLDVINSDAWDIDDTQVSEYSVKGNAGADLNKPKIYSFDLVKE